MSDDDVRFTAKDVAVTVGQALIQGVPFVGGSICQLIFGPIGELRLKRIERTLSEVVASVGEQRANIQTEEFANLLESVGVALGRAASEDKRARFRDLLIAAAHLSTGDARWEDATLAADLLQQVEAPGLAILSALARSVATQATLMREPFPRIFDGDGDFGAPTAEGIPIPYDWVTVDEWVRRLVEKRLMRTQSHHGDKGMGGAALTDLGRFLVDWIVATPEEAR